MSRDVTELPHLQETLTALALRDPLTGLDNRRLFHELPDAGLARTKRSDLPLAVPIDIAPTVAVAVPQASV